MKIKNCLLIILSLVNFSIVQNTYAFELIGGDYSWCEKLETSVITVKYETEGGLFNEVNSYGYSIGATHGTSGRDVLENGNHLMTVSFYSCPDSCLKSGANEENGILGKEYLLNTIGYEPIDCTSDLIVKELIEFDFDNDGFSGYAIRYKTAYPGFQGSRGHLSWNVSFIRNVNGNLSLLKLDAFPSKEDVSESYYHKLINKKGSLILQYYEISEKIGYEIIDRKLSFNGLTLATSS